MGINNPFKGISKLRSLIFYPKARVWLLTFLLILLSSSLAGCVTFTDFESSQVYTSDTIGTLDAKTAIGQSFVSRRPRLNGISLWISNPVSPGTIQGTNQSTPVTLRLFHSPVAKTPIFTTTILVPTTGNNLPIIIGIPDQSDPADQEYYLELIKTTGTIAINGRNEDAYPQGQAYINSQPVNADIAFRLNYDYDFSAFLTDVRQNLTSVWLVFPLIILIWLPGWLFIEFSGLHQRLDFGEQTGLSIGISLAAIPLIMLWTTILKIQWTRKGVLFCAGFMLALFLIGLLYRIFFLAAKRRNRSQNPTPEQITTAGEEARFPVGKSLILVLIFFATLAIRLIMVRDLATPAWVDSVHHSLITRLILSAGNYPSSYLPYWDFNPTAYHPGFHSVVAAFIWLVDLNLDRSLLIIGQVLNALMVFPVYLFAKTLTHRSSVGLLAATITGFITPMPAYYTSWGRYTELAGMLILPAVFGLVVSLVGEKHARQRYWLIFLGGITSAGLFLVHYRVILFLGCLIITYLVVYLPGNRSETFKNPVVLLGRVFIIAMMGILMVSPWLIQMVRSNALSLINPPNITSVPFFQDFSWSYLTAGYGKQSLVLAGLGITWGMIRLRRYAYLVVTWVGMMFLLANLSALHLPGGSLVNSTSVEIMLFMPVALLGGFFIDQIVCTWIYLLPRRLMILFMGFISVVIGTIGYFGARQLVMIINPVTVLSREADLTAIEWIKENVPANETIVINPFAWGYGLYSGNDGGSWISPLSGRLTLPPPVLYGITSEREKINALSQKVIDLCSDPSAFKDLLISNGLHNVYIGARGGVISPAKLSASGLFTILYHQDGVWIFGVKP